MSSVVGFVGTAKYAAYAASKSWTQVFAHALWYELAPAIDVLGCVAGPTRTPNYLEAINADKRKHYLEQDAVDVVEECANALGSTPSVATGVLNKISQILFSRILPVKTAVSFFSHQTALQVDT